MSSAVMVLWLLAWWSSPGRGEVDENHWECTTTIWDKDGTHYVDVSCVRIINGLWCYAWGTSADGVVFSQGHNCLQALGAVPMPPVDHVAPHVLLTNYTVAGTLDLTRPDSATVFVGPGASAVFALPNPLADQTLRISYPSSDNPAPDDSIAIEFVNAVPPTVMFHRRTILLGNGTCGGPCERTYVMTDQGQWVLQDGWASNVGATRLLSQSPINQDISIVFTSSLPTEITAGVPAGANPVALSVRAFPNPSRGSIGIQWTTQRPGRLEFALHDIAGRTLRTWEREVGVGLGTERIDLRGAGGLRPGIYSLSVRGTGASRSLKTIIVVP
jgi:hypothetical protein